MEIHPLAGHYTFEARYNAGETRFFAPARLSETVNDRIRDTALTAFAALGLRDLGRIDLIVDADGEVWFLEANVIPGMTETSLMPLAIDAAGLNAGEVYTALLLQALSR